MSKFYEAKSILKNLEVPDKQQSDICVYTFLSLLSVSEDTKWEDSTNEWIRIHDVIQFIKNNYGVVYAENSRETIRKTAMHPFRDAAFIEDNGVPTNSPRYKYRITDELLEVVISYNTSNWGSALSSFKENHETLIEIYSSKKEMRKMPVKINGQDLTFSPGKHNILQILIIKEFAPRFAPNSECLYVGDTTKKDLIKNTEKLQELGFEISLHDKMPDVVLYSEENDWIYFVEAVTSVGPMSQKRVNEIEKMTEEVESGKIFVTAFLDMKDFKKFSEEIAWETEIWVASFPDHMIHMNGDKFLGPR
ncbi:type II restriction endonuclease [Methanobrevibacter ruminantium M1]|uniref:Type II restriction endonuclease n=1 Tax=Methanobrevibacter ruminantium (strain ATCC 35063 / DSM 1093 / JCM 13430 / OCM 146 / M1) TaxID=634498 RepID=D3E3A5_METRM|nr:BsuBI/PstI family type II restriction endonuclease [Methanobrevibacter ruminantium]ADC47016.1 type II restriction endonuclease [Methanobrevibacter ruminantium M1]